MQNGKFITIEGLEGAGKSTQIKHICAYLENKGVEFLTTREPGGSDLGEKIRQLLLKDKSLQISPMTELLLMFSARSEHICKVIKPALEKGKWVISDRFTDSSFAYQGGGRLIAKADIKKLEELVQKDCHPDITFFLDVDVETGMRRLENRVEKDKIEQERDDFFIRARDVFIQRAKDEPKRIKIIDASQNIKTVETEIIKHLAKL